MAKSEFSQRPRQCNKEMKITFDTFQRLNRRPSGRNYLRFSYTTLILDLLISVRAK